MTREEIVEGLKLLEDNMVCFDELQNDKGEWIDVHELLFEAIQALSQEPCTVSVSEKETNEITEEVTLRFFKNSLKVRWHDFVIYNVEWLKKNWQMEMDIVCGVKPCDDAISREAAINIASLHCLTIDESVKALEQLPSVTRQTGKWDRSCTCSVCGKWRILESEKNSGKYKYCPNCGSAMKGE